MNGKYSVTRPVPIDVRIDWPKTSNMNTVEGNKIIMEFQGWKRSHLEYYMPPEEIRSWAVPMCPNDAKYHTSWDWLIPVVEKVVNACCNLPTIELRKEARRQYDLIEDQLCNFQIKGVHLYVVQFIQWYNNQKLVI